MNESNPPLGFPRIRWSHVARVGEPGGDDARGAPAELRAAYWYPNHAPVRRLGHDESGTLHLTLAYFAQLLEGPVKSFRAPGARTLPRLPMHRLQPLLE
jgi:hypothetical protein